MYSTKGDGSVRVRHREFVRDIVSGSIGDLFQVVKLSINPGIGTIFPWLEGLALLYESYVFNSLSFEIESTASTTDRGTVLMGIDFDAADPTPTYKQELMTYNGSVRSNVWNHCCCIASSKDLKKFGIQRYVRSLAVPVGQDIKTYDVGNLFVALQGVAANLAVGELYVTYDITLHTPQPLGLSLITARSALAAGTVGCTPVAPVGDSTGFNLHGGLSISWRSHDSMYIDNIGQWLLEVVYIGTGLDETDTLAISLHPIGNIISSSPFTVNVAKTQARNIYLLDTVQSSTYIQFSAVGATSIANMFIRVAPYATSNG